MKIHVPAAFARLDRHFDEGEHEVEATFGELLVRLGKATEAPAGPEEPAAQEPAASEPAPDETVNDETEATAQETPAEEAPE